jgi:flagellar protein FlgJ
VTDRIAPTAAVAAASGTQPQAAADKRKQLEGAAKAFEAVFMRQMIGSMRQAKLSDDDLLGGGNAADQFRDMSDAKLADSMVQKGGLGIADLLLKQFKNVGTSG